MRHHSHGADDTCVQIIFSDECTEAEGHSWHTKHFACCDCELSLGGQRYVMTDGRPFCCVCYERLYAAHCATCQQTIHVSDGHMVHGSRRWHAVDSCFRCDSCASSLLGCPFVAVPGKDAIFCADCGITHEATNSKLFVDKRDGFMGVNCLSPSSPMMKVQQSTSKAFYSEFEDVDGKRIVGNTWCEESPMKAAAKFVSPRNSPLQCKPLAAEVSTHAACMNSSSCCDDHRLSAEFQICASSWADQNKVVLESEPSTQNEKSFPRISPVKNSASDLRLAAACGAMGDVVSSPRPPVLVASGVDGLDDADEINMGLEELIVEPLWNRNEPNGLAAERAEAVGMPDDARQRSRKSKNLNVRFDPSTKDSRSPLPRGAYYERWRTSSGRSLDDSDIQYTSRGSHHHNGAGPDGSASVSISRRRLGHRRHQRQDYAGLDTDRRSHRAGMNRGSGWWEDAGDDYEHCSTCSSSSSDSDFDYGDAAFSIRTAPFQSQTLPQRRHNAGSATAVEFNQRVQQRSKKHKKKHCTVS